MTPFFLSVYVYDITCNKQPGIDGLKYISYNEDACLSYEESIFPGGLLLTASFYSLTFSLFS